ncbi:HDAg-like protein [Chinese fire belly newt virus 1]|uniref:HDAg-like protein n=1 Tax=Chinese fire belly newt virus 1 TaxID=2849697 RepID=A0A5B8ZSH5_9VIRU|nr:HDAg-like protein [Chinese fire belly newt virus 1]QED55975.1 HDAg-like protein [Chinese fire belly newt virus 1]
MAPLPINSIENKGAMASTSEARVPPVKKGKTPSRERVLSKWVASRDKLAALLREEAAERAKILALERDNPWLGTIKGIIRKSAESAIPSGPLAGPSAPSTGGDPPPKKRKRTSEKLEASPDQKAIWRAGKDAVNRAKQAMSKGKEVSSELIRQMLLAHDKLGMEVPEDVQAYVMTEVNRSAQTAPASDFGTREEEMAMVPVQMGAGPPVLSIRGFESKDGYNNGQ